MWELVGNWQSYRVTASKSTVLGSIMKRSEQVQALYDAQNELWNRLGALVSDLLAPDVNEIDEEGILSALLDLEEMLDEEKEERQSITESMVEERTWWDLLCERWKRSGDFDPIELIDLPGLENVYHADTVLKLIQSFRSAVNNRDVELVEVVFSDIDSRAQENPYLVNFDVRDEIEETISQLDVVIPRLIYRGDRSQIQKPGRKLILEVSSALTHQIARNPTLLYALTPREFEEFIAELFAGFGYQVQLTARTRDGGRDIIAARSDHGILSKLLIECKRFSATRPVGLSYVRELYAVKILERATKAILATTSYFTRDARLLESQLIYELELKDFEAVSAWAREYSGFLRRIRRGL